MNKAYHIESFSTLGKWLYTMAKNANEQSFTQATNQNPWFTHQFIKDSLLGLAFMLTHDKLDQWLANYEFGTTKKTVGIITAGNIPLVGFHDILCVLVSGNKALIKLSSKDQWLYKEVFNKLFEINSNYQNQLEITSETLTGIDAIIATGSNNTARYFDYYFGKYPNIIRKNRNSVAIINGTESEEDLEVLGQDVFLYFGLGCRNVSHLLLPENYDIKKLMKAFESHQELSHHHKYFNNYEYQKTIHLLNIMPHFDNGFVLLKEDASINSAIGIVNYSFYKTEQDLLEFEQVNKHKIQCIVSKTKQAFSTYSLGEAQKPELWDYADNIDTLQFLSQLNQ